MSIYSFDTNIFSQQFLPTRKRNVFSKSWVKMLLVPIQWLIDVLFGSYAYGDTTSIKVTNYHDNVNYAIGDIVYYNVDKIIYICISPSAGNLPDDISFFSPKTFSLGERMIFVDKAIYEAIDSVTGTTYTTGVFNISNHYFIKVQDNFIGLIERTKTNSQTLLFESILNQWFNTSFNYPTTTNDIYIATNVGSNNSFVFGVNESESSNVSVTDLQQDSFIDTAILISTSTFTIYFPLLDYDVLSPDEPSGTTVTKDNIVRSFVDKYVCAGISYTITTY